jgi:F-type H+-transporting ATPase subunit epsilon
MKVLILSIEGVIYEGNSSSVKLPGSIGSFHILNGHSPILAKLTFGLVILYDPDKSAKKEKLKIYQNYRKKKVSILEIKGGLLEANQKEVTVLMYV